MSKRSVQASKDGLHTLIQTKASKHDDDGKRLTYPRIAAKAGLDEKTVKKFFYGHRVDRDSALAIAEKALGLKVTDVVDPVEWEQPTTTPKLDQTSRSAIAPLDLQNYCRRMLPVGLTTNPLLNEDGVILTIEDIVPLELVERKKRPQHEGDFSPEHFQTQAPTEYETPVAHNQFFEQVLENGNSPKSQGRKIAIIGEPGAGKTTLLQEIANWVERAGGLPIFVKLADLQGKSLEDYLLKNWLKLVTQKPRVTQDIEDDFVAQFNAGRVWLLLDGIDEMPESGNLLSSFADQLKGWVAQARIVLTCRLNVWDVNKNALYTFDTYRALELTYPDMVGEFIRRFFSKVGEPTKGEKLIEKLDQSQQRLRDLVKNPLRLTLLCRTWKRRQGKLPQTKAELYKRFAETFYEWKDKPQISLEKRQQLEQALGALAKRAIDEEATKFRLRETLIREELDKFDKSLFDLSRGFGWINQVGVAAEHPDEAVYAFFHPTFQEYFAACAIADWHYFLNHTPHNLTQGTYRIFEPQWKEVILLWLGRQEVAKEQKEAFVKALVTFEYGCKDEKFYWYRACFLAAAGIAEFKACNLADAIVKRMVEWSCISSGSLSQTAQITLLETEGSRVVDVLTPLLSNTQHEWRRLVAATGLVKIGVNLVEAIATLTELTHYSSFEPIEMMAARVLLRVEPDNPEAMDKVGFDLAEAAYIKELQTFYKNSESIATLIKRLCFAPDKTTRLQAAQSLMEIEEVSYGTSISKLIDSLHTEKDEGISVRTAYLLGEIGFKNPDAIAYLIGLLNTQDRFTLTRAIESLEKIAAGNPNVIKALTQLLHNSPNKEIQYQVAVSLGKLDPGNLEVVPILIELLGTHLDIKQDPFAPQGLFAIIHSQLLDAAVDIISKALQGNLFQTVVTGLKDCLQELEYKTNPQFRSHSNRDQCYQLIWHCAQKMTYPAFYRAWHSPHTTHPEVLETMGVGSNPLTQNLNLAELPQSLRAAIKNNSQLNQTIHLICIDGSKFINSDNPAAEIYDQMLDRDCSERQNGEPETMQALKIYWNSLRRKSDRILVLVFYENPADSPLQRFSHTFLHALGRFDGAICVVTGQPMCNLPLQQFSANQPQLIENIVGWIRATAMESL